MIKWDQRPLAAFLRKLEHANPWRRGGAQIAAAAAVRRLAMTEIAAAVFAPVLSAIPGHAKLLREADPLQLAGRAFRDFGEKNDPPQHLESGEPGAGGRHTSI